MAPPFAFNKRETSAVRAAARPTQGDITPPTAGESPGFSEPVHRPPYCPHYQTNTDGTDDRPFLPVTGPHAMPMARARVTREGTLPPTSRYDDGRTDTDSTSLEDNTQRDDGGSEPLLPSADAGATATPTTDDTLAGACAVFAQHDDVMTTAIKGVLTSPAKPPTTDETVLDPHFADLLGVFSRKMDQVTVQSTHHTDNAHLKCAELVSQDLIKVSKKTDELQTDLGVLDVGLATFSYDINGQLAKAATDANHLRGELRTAIADQGDTLYGSSFPPSSFPLFFSFFCFPPPFPPHFL